jgi:hypothetical protein
MCTEHTYIEMYVHMYSHVLTCAHIIMHRYMGTVETRASGLASAAGAAQVFLAGQLSTLS